MEPVYEHRHVAPDGKVEWVKMVVDWQAPVVTRTCPGCDLVQRADEPLAEHVRIQPVPTNPDEQGWFGVVGPILLIIITVAVVVTLLFGMTWLGTLGISPPVF